MTDRIDRLRAVAASHGADGAIVSHPANRRYFSGFPGIDLAPDEAGGVLLVTGDEAILYTGTSNLPWAEGTVRPPVVARNWERPWSAFLGRQLQELGVRRVAFEDRAMTVADHTAIVEAASAVTTLIPIGGAFQAVRAIKDEEELALIAKAVRVTDEAFVAATTALEPGISERDLAWRIDLALRECGSDGPAFETIVASGPHAARPHHQPTDREIQAGEPIVIDMGAFVDGYCGDLTRTIVVGEAPALFTDRYNTVLAAQQTALAGIRAGLTGGETDNLAREALTASGFGEQFLHWIGHGVGLVVHEGPLLSPDSEEVVQPGHVITVEPGIYFEGWGGIRIEDMGVVRDKGLEVLSNAPK
jgi:Xaa-Pro aminopeptidase